MSERIGPLDAIRVAMSSDELSLSHVKQSDDERLLRANARAYANVYLSRGKITKTPCVKCGSPFSQMHHEDYSKPLEVQWLCRGCHVDEHGGATKPARHGTGNCAKCDQPKVINSAYCTKHRNEYQNQWRKDRTKKFHELLQKAREHRL